MKFTFNDFDNNRYSFKPGIDNNRHLEWISSAGVNTIILKCPYNADIESILQALTDADITLVIQPDATDFQYVNINGMNIGMKYITALGKLIQNNIKIEEEPQTLFVTAADLNNDGSEVDIYRPRNINEHIVHIPMKVEITYSREIIERKKRRKVIEEPTGFYIVDINKLKISNFNDGDIYYLVDNVKIPITRKMIVRDQPIYIKCENLPGFYSTDNGLEIECVEI